MQKPILHIQLLGDFKLTYADTPVTSVDSARLQALLAFLLLHRDASQSRQHLAFLFWPDSSEANARSNLRQLLFSLRHALPDAERFVQADAATVQWCAEAPFTVDVDQLEQADVEAQRAARDHDRAREQAARERMIALYHGDLLPSCYDDWTSSPREYLRQKWLQALQELIDLLEEKRDYAAALRYAQRLLQHDPLHEETYQRLMRLHGRCGNRAGVASVYQTCANVLQRELGIKPSAETRQVYDALVRSKPVPMVQAPPAASPLHPNNLPIPLTRFIGRARELAEIERLIPERRLLTLTGTGGVGKTRLALAAANDLLALFPDGVWFVDLAPLTDPALVPQALAAVLHLQENKSSVLLDSIVEYLRDKNVLLVLDNCEHLVEACARLVETLLQSAPRLHVLLTSRQVLGLASEMPWQVPSLAVPSPQDTAASGDLPVKALLQFDSIQLFVDRAATTLPTFTLTAANAAAVRQICHALDGLPLAVELAAARSRVLSPEQIVSRLDDRFGLLANGNRLALPRQKTLGAALDWSYDLLSEPEQVFFQELSVFAGGFTLEAVEAVCGKQASMSPNQTLDLLSLLSHLIDKSLVAVEAREGAMRYRMLETIRQYAREKLRLTDRSDSLRASHCAYFLQLTEEAEPTLRGENQLTWLNRLQTEYDNILAAMEWSYAQAGAPTCLRFGSALWYFWNVRGYWTEGRERLTKMLAMPGAMGCTRTRAKALLGAGYLAFQQGDYDIARTCFEASMEISRTTDDKKGMADTLFGLGSVAQSQGDLAKAQAFFAEGLARARASNDPWNVGLGLLSLGVLKLNQDDYGGAQELLSQGLAAFRLVGDARNIAKVLGNLGLIGYFQGDYVAARPLYEEALAIRRQLRDKVGIAGQLDNLAYVAFHQGELERAKALFRESLVLFGEIHGKRSIADVMYGLAALAAPGDPKRAARLLGAAQALLEGLGARVGVGNQAEYECAFAVARAQMPPAAFEAAQAAGREMSLEQAIQYALT